jgi:hypothetical protein
MARHRYQKESPFSRRAFNNYPVDWHRNSACPNGLAPKPIQEERPEAG